MEELAFSMQKLQQQINDLAGQRDNELTGIERKLHDLEDKAYELKQSWNDDDWTPSGRYESIYYCPPQFDEDLSCPLPYVTVDESWEFWDW